MPPIRLLEELTETQQYIPAGTFHPTLILGLGGTGAGVVRRVKRLIQQRYGPQWNVIRYLCIDSDSRTFDGEPGFPPLEKGETCDISLLRKPALDLMREIDERGQHREMKAWLSPGLTVKLLAGAGAGTVRQCGRFCLYAHFKEVNQALDAAHGHLVGLPEQIKALRDVLGEGVRIDPHPVIYVVSSCCGGTGSGILLDIAVLLRSKFQANPPTIKAILAMPNVFEEKVRAEPLQRQRVQANAVAALREIQYAMDEDELKRGRWRFDYPDPSLRNLVADQPLFDECFVVELCNSQGQELASYGDVYELAARALVQEAGSPIGAQVDARVPDLYAAGLDRPCLETGRPRILGSLAVTSVVVPAAELLTYCALRQAIEVLDSLKGASAADTGAQITEFLSTHSLLERGAENNQIIDTLLTRLTATGPALMSGTAYELRDEDSQKSQDELLRLQDQRWAGVPDAADEAGLGARAFAQDVVKPRVQMNREILEGVRSPDGREAAAGLTSKRDAILKRALELTTTSGVEAALRWLNLLQAEFSAVALELRAEADQVAKIHTSDRLTQLRQKVAGIHLGTEAERRLVAGHNEAVGIAVLQPAREEAARLLDSLRGWINGELVQTVRNARNIIEDAQRDLEERRSQLVKALEAPTARSSGYTLEFPSMGIPEFEAFYQKNRSTAIGKVLDDWVKGLGGDLGAYLHSGCPDLGRRLVRHCAALFRGRLSTLNVVEAIKNRAQGATGGSTLLKELDYLFNYSEPFWQMQPRGSQGFQQTAMISVPVPEAVAGQTDEGERLEAEVKKWLDERLTAGDVRPDPIRANYAFALEVCRRVYGARPYYHMEWEVWKRSYEQLRGNARLPLHVHRDYETTVPAWEYVLPARSDFALALAFGLIAKRGRNKFYFGVDYDPESTKRPAPKYKSDLDAVWPWGKQPAPKADLEADDLLTSDGRTAAMEVFTKRADMLDRARAAVEALRDEGKSYTKALRTHQARLSAALKKAGTKLDLVQQLQLELDCIGREIEEMGT